MIEFSEKDKEEIGQIMEKYRKLVELYLAAMIIDIAVDVFYRKGEPTPGRERSERGRGV